MKRTVISLDGKFEWDKEKSLLNARKHGFYFDEILEVFDDPCFLVRYDEEHSFIEDRFHGIGCFNGVLFILVCFTCIKDRIRIISAKKAGSELKVLYEQNCKKILL